MKKKLIVILLIVAAAVITNPDRTHHQDQINERFKGDNPLAGALGAGNLAASSVKYNNYYVCSLTSFDGNMVSVGVFNFVIVRNLNLKQILKG